MWSSRALCALGQHTAKRLRTCTRKSRACLQLCQIFTDLKKILTSKLSNSLYRVGQKVGRQTHDHTSVKFLTDLKKITGRFPGKFVVRWILKIPPHLAYVGTLPWETLMSTKQAISNKLEGNVAAYWRYGGVVNNQIKKGLLLSLRVKKINIGEYLAKLQLSKSVVVSCTLRAWPTHC